MADEPFDKDTGRAIVEVYKQELEIKSQELAVLSDGIQARSKDLENQKEIALKNIDAYGGDREQERQMYQRESTKEKTFIFLLVLIFVIFAGFLVMQEHIELLDKLITLAIGAVGGSGITIIYFMRKRDSD